YRGHLYNWYDTRSLRPLEPRYVSSVDSGNLAGHLSVLAVAARERVRRPIVGVEIHRGIDAALALLREALASESRAPVAELRAGPLDRGLLAPTLEALEESARAAESLLKSLDEVAHAARELFDGMDFAFLFDQPRRIFAIGYRVADGSLDEGGYDLLASEARLTSFVAIARGDVPAVHWFRLARPMTPVESGIALVSWSGSMFEYLMPGLVMREPDGSLLEQTCRLAVQRQISYAQARGVPWGISESAYNVRDLDLTYQYSSFGVPGLGLERGLGDDLVIAPYATALAAMVDSAAAARNFGELERAGGLGPYGFYEALDYTRSRLPEG